MEQEQILSELKSRIGISGETAFDRSIKAYIEKNLPEEGLDADDDYLNKHSDVLKSFYGQYNHDVAETVRVQSNAKFEEFKKNYKPNTVNTKEPEQDKDTLSLLRSIQEKLEANEQKELEAQKAAQREQVISEAYEQAKSSGADSEPVLKIVKQLIKVEDGDTSLSVKSKIVELYNKTYKELYGEGAAPVFSSGGSGNKKASIEKYKQHLVQSGRIKEK